MWTGQLYLSLAMLRITKSVTRVATVYGLMNSGLLRLYLGMPYDATSGQLRSSRNWHRRDGKFTFSIDITMEASGKRVFLKGTVAYRSTTLRTASAAVEDEDEKACQDVVDRLIRSCFRQSSLKLTSSHLLHVLFFCFIIVHLNAVVHISQLNLESSTNACPSCYPIGA